MCYSWKADAFIHLRNNDDNRWSRASSPSNNRGQQAQQVAGHPRFSTETPLGRLKFIASGEDGDNKKPRAKHREHRLAQRRQRLQHSDHKHVQRQRQNTTITPQVEPMKRENTDCRRFKKRCGDQATLTVYSKIIFFDATIGRNSYTICTMHVKNIFPTDWGQPISLYTMSNTGFYSKRYFTMNSL